MESDIQKFKEDVVGIRRETRRQTINYIVAAFGLVAGLAWNDAVKTLIEYFLPTSTNAVFAKFLYAIMITTLVVFVSYHLVKLVNRDKGSI